MASSVAGGRAVGRSGCTASPIPDPLGGQNAVLKFLPHAVAETPCRLPLGSSVFLPRGKAGQVLDVVCVCVLFLFFFLPLFAGFRPCPL